MLGSEEISAVIKERIKNFESSPQWASEGTILTVRDRIVQVYGITEVMSGEVVQFQDGSCGLALNLEQDITSVAVLGSGDGLKEGQRVSCTGRLLHVPVGRALLGRVVNALGVPIDNRGAVATEKLAPIEKIAPGVMSRKTIDQPLATGIKAVDAMVPIGRGQRELIIGDRQTGKTSLAIDAIINQRHTGVKCVYVAVGQKTPLVANLVRELTQHGAMEYTVVVAATASASAAEQYISVYAGCSIAEYFRDQGEDVLIVYDDLTKHAWAYRQIALLLRRPPGREAYPGDIFYLHSRLLERAARVNEQYVEQATNGRVRGKTGSITALPIVETQAGDISAFIPTNIISITDGQIFLENNLFNHGIRPAINAGLSVSRVGSAAQTNLIKKFGQSLRLALAQYRELEAFSQFASELDETTKQQLAHGARAIELLKQNNFAPLEIALMAISLLLVEKQLLADIAVNQVIEFERQLHLYFSEHHRELLDRINQHPGYSEELEQQLQQLIEQFKQQLIGVT